MRVLVVGWFSFLHGEATAGDVLAMEAVRAGLGGAGVPHDVAWSAVMCPAGGLRYDRAIPERYSDVVFVCGPVHGEPVRDLHRRFHACRRLAVGVSVLDPGDPAVTGFHRILVRDGPGMVPRRDLAALPATRTVPVLGVCLTHGQREYGERRRHEQVTEVLGAWLHGLDAARLALDTRLDPRDWRTAATPDQVESVVRRLDVMVTTRLHGLVLALKNDVPVLAVDPVDGGGKVSAQACAWGWPGVLPAAGLDGPTLDRALAWCLSGGGSATSSLRHGGGPAREA
jgi:hypothetical protein